MHVSSGEDTVQCKVCQQDAFFFKNHIAKRHKNHPVNLQNKVDNQMEREVA